MVDSRNKALSNTVLREFPISQIKDQNLFQIRIKKQQKFASVFYRHFFLFWQRNLSIPIDKIRNQQKKKRSHTNTN